MAHSVEITHDRGGYFRTLEEAYNFCGSDLSKNSGLSKDRDTCVAEYLKRCGF